MKTSKQPKPFVAKASGMMLDNELVAVRALVEKRGPRGAARLLGLSERTVLALLARVPVYLGNVVLARQKLAEMTMLDTARQA